MGDKKLFLGLSAVVLFINVCMQAVPAPGDIWLGLAVSVVSIPAWTLVGSAFASVGLFLFRFAKIDVTSLSIWQRADVGLAMAVVLKPALGIPF